MLIFIRHGLPRGCKGDVSPSWMAGLMDSFPRAAPLSNSFPIPNTWAAHLSLPILGSAHLCGSSLILTSRESPGLYFHVLQGKLRPREAKKLADKKKASLEFSISKNPIC